MNDAALKELLEEIDRSFVGLIPKLEKAGQALVQKAKDEKNVDLSYSIGWEEGGIDCLCLQKGDKNFPTWDEGWHWRRSSVEPLFEGLEILYFDAPFGLGDRF